MVSIIVSIKRTSKGKYKLMKQKLLNVLIVLFTCTQTQISYKKQVDFDGEHV